MIRKVIFSIAILFPLSVSAQVATWMPSATDPTKGIGWVYTTDGKVGLFTSINTIQPTPPVPTVPFKVSGLYVLTVHDPLKNGSLPQTQVDVFSAKSVRDWLTTNCAKDAAGTPAFRFLRPGQDVSKEKDGCWTKLQTAVGSGANDPSWILIDDKHWSGVEKVPTTIEATLARLNAFKGGK